LIEGWFVLTCDLEELNIVTKTHPSSILTEFSDFDSMPYIKHMANKGKVHPITCHGGKEREYRYRPTLLFNIGVECAWVVNATPRPLYLRQRHGTHYIGGLVSPRAGLDR